MLRKFADSILKRIETLENDRDFKEFLMLHKGEISQVYASTGISKSMEAKYTKIYMEAVNEYIDREIFEMRSKDTGKANLLVEMARNLGVSEHSLESLAKAFSKGDLVLSDLSVALRDEVRRAQQEAIRQELRSLIREELKNGENMQSDRFDRS